MPNLPETRRPPSVTIRSDAQGITVVNSAGHEIRIAISPSTEGFTPFELQAAALGACTSLGLRREARAAELADAVREFRVRVAGFKAGDPPSRLQRFEVRVAISGDLPTQVKEAVIRKVERNCSIANTLRSAAAVDAALDVHGEDHGDG